MPFKNLMCQFSEEVSLCNYGLVRKHIFRVQMNPMRLKSYQVSLAKDA